LRRANFQICHPKVRTFLRAAGSLIRRSNYPQCKMHSSSAGKERPPPDDKSVYSPHEHLSPFAPDRRKD